MAQRNSRDLGSAIDAVAVATLKIVHARSLIEAVRFQYWMTGRIPIRVVLAPPYRMIRGEPMPAYTIKPLVTATATNTGGRNGHSETTDHSVSVNLSVRKEMGGPGRPGTTTPEPKLE